MFPHRSYTLQFVSGLGPRKGKSLINAIAKLPSKALKGKDKPRLVRKNHIFSEISHVINYYVLKASVLNSRNDLVLFELMTWNVFLNSASFLRIRRRYFVDFNNAADHDILDDTRIHPEDYELARKMAADALEIDDVLDADDNDSQNVWELMTTKPDKLDDLLLDDYAVELERSNNTKKRYSF